MAVLFYWNMSRRPFLGQVVNSVLLLAKDSILSIQICFYAFSIPTPANDGKIEQKNECGFGL